MPFLEDRNSVQKRRDGIKIGATKLLAELDRCFFLGTVNKTSYALLTTINWALI